MGGGHLWGPISTDMQKNKRLESGCFSGERKDDSRLHGSHQDGAGRQRVQENRSSAERPVAARRSQLGIDWEFVFQGAEKSSRTTWWIQDQREDGGLGF